MDKDYTMACMMDAIDMFLPIIIGAIINYFLIKKSYDAEKLGCGILSLLVFVSSIHPLSWLFPIIIRLEVPFPLLMAFPPLVSILFYLWEFAIVKMFLWKRLVCYIVYASLYVAIQMAFLAYLVNN